MTRRQFLLVAPAASLPQRRDELLLPVRLLVDTEVKWRPDAIGRFRSHLWTQAVADLARCGIRVETTLAEGRVERPSQREPIITGLERGVVNFVITSTIPIAWDRGRSLDGLATRYRGYHLCMAALNYAHGNLVPFLSVNTCLHELLHALLHDIFEDRPSGVRGEAREFRVDYHGTLLWLLRGDTFVRDSASRYVQRLAATR